MNKKFFTLIAGTLLLAASLGTAKAQYAIGKSPTVRPTSINVKGELVYQLRVNTVAEAVGANGDAVAAGAVTQVLAHVQIAPGQQNAGRYQLVSVSPTAVPLANTLWRLTTSGNAEEYPSYTFVNVGTRQTLSFNSKTATQITTSYDVPTGEALFTGGDVSIWKWQLSSKPADNTLDWYSVYSAFSTDSAVALTIGTAANYTIVSGSEDLAVANAAPVGAVKYAFANNPARVGGDPLVYLTPYEATPILLSADDLNSLLWTQSPIGGKVKFSFTPEVKNSALSEQLKNLFTSNEYTAVPAIGFPADYALLPDRPGATPGDPLISPYESIVNTNTAYPAPTGASTAYDIALYNYQQYVWKSYEYQNLKNTVDAAGKLADIILANRTALTAASGTFTAQIQPILNTTSPTGTLLWDVLWNLQNVLTAAGVVQNYPPAGSYPTYGGSYPAGTVPYVNGVDVITGFGPRTVKGTVAHFIATHPSVRDRLLDPSTTPFQRAIIEAVIALEETQLIDPTNSIYPAWHSVDYLFNLVDALDGGTDVYNIINNIGTATGNITATQAKQQLLTLIGTNMPVQTFRPFAAPAAAYPNLALTSDNVDDLKRTVDQLYLTARNSVRTLNSDPDARWVSLQYKAGTAASPATYLSVDTNYITTDRRDLGFKIQEFEDVGTTFYPHLSASYPARLDLNGRFNFQFQYFPTKDSIVIRTGGFAKKLDAPVQTRWGQLNPVQNGDLGIGKAGIQSTDITAIDAHYYSNNWIYPDRNLVKLEPLTNRSEVTVGSSDYTSYQDPRTTINTWIRINGVDAAEVPTTLTDGLYFINLHTSRLDRAKTNGAYKIVPIWDHNNTYFANEETNQLNGTIQNFGYMPATQWVIEQHAGDGKTNLVNIYNREYPDVSYENVQLYKTTRGAEYITLPFATSANNDIFNQDFINGIEAKDSLLIKPVSAVKPAVKAAYEDEYLGYYKEKSAQEHFYKLDYLSGLKEGNFLKVGSGDTLIYVDIYGESVDFELVPEDFGDSQYNNAKYGYTGRLADKAFKQLKREGYRIRVKAPNLLNVNNKFITIISEGVHLAEPVYAVTDAFGNYFLLKENNRTDKPYFAIEEAWAFGGPIRWSEDDFRAGVKDGELKLTAENWQEKRVAAFALSPSTNYLYRRFDGDTYGKVKEPYGDKTNTPVWLQFYKFNNPLSDFLSENSPNNTIANGFREGLRDKTISFLGVLNRYQYPEKADTLSYTFYVDTAYVRNNTVMPQYMLALHPDTVAENWYTHVTDGKWIDRDGNVYELDEPTEETFYLPSLVKAEYLFNATDSVLKGNEDYLGKFSYGAEGSTRFAFVTGVHFRDTFYVLPDAYKNLEAKTIARDTLKYLQDLPDYRKHNLGENTHYVPRWGYTVNPVTGAEGIDLIRNEEGEIVNNGKSMVFQFRLIDNEDRRFLIETTTARTVTGWWDDNRDYYNAVHNNGTYPHTWVDEIAPGRGQWLAVKSILLPVVSTVTDIVQGSQNTAEIFDVRDGEPGSATANEAVVSTAVKVISEAGAVTILNAAGKSVSISNILGQTVAATVLTSDNARVALPKGIVIVAVEGEAAIKAVVK